MQAVALTAMPWKRQSVTAGRRSSRGWSDCLLLRMGDCGPQSSHTGSLYSCPASHMRTTVMLLAVSVPACKHKLEHPMQIFKACCGTRWQLHGQAQLPSAQCCTFANDLMMMKSECPI